jgi:hypothetical protein
MTYLLVKDVVYEQTLSILFSKTYRDVFEIVRAFQNSLIDENGKLVRVEAVQSAVDYMNATCIHAEVFEVIAELRASVPQSLGSAVDDAGKKQPNRQQKIFKEAK